MKHIETHCLLAHPPDAVWAVLTDFPAYADWNPLNVWADGKPERGARVPMQFVNPGRPGSFVRQTVTITDVRLEQRLEWVGHVPLLFTGRHYFELRPTPEGTALTHGEHLAGLVPMLWSAARIEAQRTAYERMNQALARRLDALAKR